MIKLIKDALSKPNIEAEDSAHSTQKAVNILITKMNNQFEYDRVHSARVLLTAIIALLVSLLSLLLG